MYAYNIASEIISATLSGCPLVTDSEVNVLYISLIVSPKNNIILKYSSEIILMIVLIDILPDGACILVGITAGEILFPIVYYLTLKILFKIFEENKDTLVVT